MTGLASRLGDRVNPIVVKEARQAVNSRLVGATLLVFLGVQLLVMVLMIGYREAASTGDIDMRAGRDVFMFVQAVLLGTCLLLVPALTGGRLAAERSDVNVDLLFVTSLTPRAIMAGKLVTAAATALLIFSACAPFMTFAYVLRGLDFPTIALVLAADFLVVMFGTMFALLLAAVPANRGGRIVLGIGGFVFLCVVFSYVVAMTADFLRYGGSRFDTASAEFWLGFLGVALGVAGAIGLMFVWATALITPPTANRALVVRAYTLGYWLVAAVGCAVWSWYIADPGPVYVWGVCGAVVFALQMLVGVSERDELGPRVRRRIPRNALLRGPAWYLTSGAAGGIAFALFGGALSAAGILVWHGLTRHTTMSWTTRWWAPAVVAGMIIGYAYGYGLTAVLVRRLLRNTALKGSYTWLVALILFGLGCMGPFLVRVMFLPRQYGYGYPPDTLWLYLPNPVVMIDNATGSMHPLPELTYTFLLAWGGVVTLANVPWLVKQVRDFRPPDGPDEPDAAETP